MGLIWEIRHRRKSSGYSTYLEVSKLFIESSLLLIEKPSLRSLYFYDDKYRNSSDDEKEMSAYCDSLIMMLENVWDCYDRGYFRSGILKGFKNLV